MTIKGAQADFAAVLDHDYFVRYEACSRILKANDIPLEISDIRRVFACIASLDEPDTDELRQQFLQGQAELIRFINEYGQPLPYDRLTPAEITEYFLDACCRRSAKPDLALIRELVEHGADIRAHDKTGFAALKLATSAYDHEIMNFFLERGADINEVIRYKDQITSTVWLEKVAYAELPDLKLMLKHGASAVASDSAGNTPLMKYCAAKPVSEGVAMLLQHGADPTAENNDGNSALHLIAAADADGAAVKLLIDAGSAINKRNRYGDAPLHLNARFQLAGNEKITEALLENGADPNCRNSDGDTPLLLAAGCDKQLVVKALVKHGADLNIRNTRKKTAYEIALSRGFVQTAGYMELNAAADYEKKNQEDGLPALKKQIIERLKAGFRHSQSDREGYSVFSFRGEAYAHERFENGAAPPDITTYATDEAALAYLYATNRSYRDNETEVSVYQSIFQALQK